MIKDIIENEEYKNLVEKQIKENVLFLLEKNQDKILIQTCYKSYKIYWRRNKNGDQSHSELL